MLSRPFVPLSVLLLGHLAILAVPCSACHAAMTSCPYFTQINQAVTSTIPIPVPSRLDSLCREYTEGLKCLTGRGVTEKCQNQPSLIASFNAILEVTKYPCQIAKTEYLLGKECWALPDLQKSLQRCFMLHQKNISSNYCNGMLGFNRCLNSRILQLATCGEREQRILAAMATVNYNTNGRAFSPPCPIQPVESLQPAPATTPTAATTAATTIIATISATTQTMTTPSNGDWFSNSVEVRSRPLEASTKQQTRENSGGGKQGQWKSSASTSMGSQVVRARILEVAAFLVLAALCSARV